VSTPRIEVHADAGALATAAAGELLSRLADTQSRGGVPQIVLTGGSIADAVHREIARLSPGSGVDWAKVVVWWGDERFVAPDDSQRNAGQARANVLDAVGVDPANVHEIPSTADARDVDDAAAQYAATLEEHGPADFDVLMLGVGPDGHVASLFPGRPELDVEDRSTVGVTESPKPPPNRVSLTYPRLNGARSVWFLVSTAEKADAVARALGDTDRHEIPASGVTGRDETIWFLDRDAASAI
jgi:6-phosphogluconolactonase